MMSNEFWKSKDPKIVIVRVVIVVVVSAVMYFGVLGNDLPFNIGTKTLEVRGISADTAPLASTDMKLVKNGSSYEVIGTLKKVSAEPEQSYFSFIIHLVDENGKYITEDHENTKSMPAFTQNSTYHFEKTIRFYSSSKPVAVEFVRINEISWEELEAERAASLQQSADRQADKEARIAQILENNSWNATTAVNILNVQHGSTLESYTYKSGESGSDGINQYFIISRWRKNTVTNKDEATVYKVLSNGRVETLYNYSDEQLAKHSAIQVTESAVSDTSSTDTLQEQATTNKADEYTESEGVRGGGAEISSSTTLNGKYTDYSGSLSFSFDGDTMYAYVFGIRTGTYSYRIDGDKMYCEAIALLTDDAEKSLVFRYKKDDSVLFEELYLDDVTLRKNWEGFIGEYDKIFN